MSKFSELYNADIARYGGEPGPYLKVFFFLLRKAATTTFTPQKAFYRILFKLWAYNNKIEMKASDLIGGGLYLGHPYNITINHGAKIGRNCNIHKGAVIGQANRGSRKGCPVLGDKVYVGINAAIVGKITIGDDVMIAPNSFVNIDIPSHSVVFGNPCVIKHRDYATEGYVNFLAD